MQGLLRSSVLGVCDVIGMGSANSSPKTHKPTTLQNYWHLARLSEATTRKHGLGRTVALEIRDLHERLGFQASVTKPNPEPLHPRVFRASVSMGVWFGAFETPEVRGSFQVTRSLNSKATCAGKPISAKGLG